MQCKLVPAACVSVQLPAGVSLRSRLSSGALGLCLRRRKMQLTHFTLNHAAGTTNHLPTHPLHTHEIITNPRPLPMPTTVAFSRLTAALEWSKKVGLRMVRISSEN